MNTDIEEIILKKLKASKILHKELIQNLWSGYGELSRIRTDVGPIILKLIQLPEGKSHPRGWSTNIGHERKKKSYKVEKNWYEFLRAENILKARMAKGLGSGEIDGLEYILLEDLKESGFQTKSHISWPDVENCLKWLAFFHQHFLGYSPKNLWDIGTYWHLDTRPEELEALTDISLKEAAPLIDKKLNEAKYQTIVHGDAKLSNFLFNTKEAAAVDFQYVGGGVGIKDVAYFMSSIFEEDELEANEEKCLLTYFRFLNQPEVEEEWRELYPYAWCDFYRFLKGWSPGHWKINSYSEKMKERTLKCL